MRKLDEVRLEMEAATRTNDVATLERLVGELEAFDTEEASALAHRVRSTLARLSGNYAVALEEVHAALALCSALGDARGVASARAQIAQLNMQLSGDFVAAAAEFEHAASLYEDLGDHDNVAFILNTLGRVHTGLGDYPTALESLHRGLQLVENRPDLPIYASLTASIGTVHAQAGDYPTALEYLHKALVMQKEIGNLVLVAGLMMNIGTIHTLVEDYDAALENLARAHTMHQDLGIVPGEALSTGNMGRLYKKMGDLSQGLSHLQRALDLHRQMGDAEGQKIDLVAIAECHLHMGDLAEARRYVELLEQFTDSSSQDRVARLTIIGQLMQADNDLEGAVRSLTDALEEAASRGMKQQEASLHRMLRDIAQLQNDFPGYIEHNNAFTTITNEINGKEAALKLATQQKNRELEEIEVERQRERAVLYSALPKDVADRIIRGEDVSGDHYDHASVIFLDVAGFTRHSNEVSAQETTRLLATIFDTFDAICQRNEVTKIKTIGDAYLAVAFRHDAEESSPEVRAAHAATEMLHSSFSWPNGEPVVFRIGVHSGPVVAGVIGTQRLQYDVWGDTVNTASRMESSGEPGRIQCSESFARALCLVPRASGESDQEPGTWHQALVERGTIDIKGKGTMTTYWLEHT